MQLVIVLSYAFFAFREDTENDHAGESGVADLLHHPHGVTWVIKKGGRRGVSIDPAQAERQYHATTNSLADLP